MCATHGRDRRGRELKASEAIHSGSDPREVQLRRGAAVRAVGEALHLDAVEPLAHPTLVHGAPELHVGVGHKWRDRDAREINPLYARAPILLRNE